MQPEHIVHSESAALEPRFRSFLKLGRPSSKSRSCLGASLGEAPEKSLVLGRRLLRGDRVFGLVHRLAHSFSERVLALLLALLSALLSALKFLRRNDLLAAVHAGFFIQAVRQAKILSVLNYGGRPKRMMAPAVLAVAARMAHAY